MPEPDSAESRDDTLRLALGAAGAGVIALVTLAGEIQTRQLPAELVGFERGFVSVPLGVATLLLAALAARTDLRYALPAALLGFVYWGVAALYW